jgi:lycopene cyclase domain-containing protein
MMLFSVIILLNFYDRWYTLIDFLFLAVAAVLGYLYGRSVLRRFLIAFPIILIPFFLVNGVLTGTGLPEPVVWYNDSQNMGIRIGTIPVEDMAYAFSMLFFNLLLIELWKKD